MICVTLTVVCVFSFLVVRYYEDRREAGFITTTTSAMALAISLLALLVIPVDIFTVSSSLTSDGVETDPNMVELSGTIIRYLYYGLYGLLLVFAFALLPFAYFFYEEEDERSTPAKQARGALRYTLVFVFVWLILLTVALVTQSRIKGTAAEDWQENLQQQFTAGDSVLAYSFSFLAVLGLLGWLTYTPFGLVALPYDVFKNFHKGAEGDLQEHPTAEQSSKRRLRLRTLEEELATIKARYEYTDRPWSLSDKARFVKLEREQAQLKRLQNKQPDRQVLLAQPDDLDCCSRCWNCLAPVRCVLALFLFLVSLLVWLSILLTTLDRFLNSDCKFQCSYTLTTSRLPNPIDLGLIYFSKFFPLDFFLFGLLMLYMFFASLIGLTKLGVRICCFKMYDVEKYATMSNALIMGIWLLVMLLAALNLQVWTIAPQYSLFGTQFYYEWQLDDSTNSDPADGSVSPVVCGPSVPGCIRVGEAQPCTVGSTNEAENYCTPSQVGNFLLMINTQIPLFGAVIFYTNIIFLLSFVVSLVLVTRKTSKNPLARPLWGPDTDLGEKA
eukprot:gb/GEZN01004707.1/.p1 GENE.gb/GEZN01004707.1/~~gb/GEZN01004707.1/.p1  ORF type:complete len:577 (-),score=126.37 gb/GEZN01004707.1/:186-1850(-)